MKQLGLLGNDQDVTPVRDRALALLTATKGIAPVTISSISGGRSSAYMAINHPTDYVVFACVLTNHESHAVKDSGLLKAVQQKIPAFAGSLELPNTLRCVLELEQRIGQEIAWVHGLTFEQVVSNKGNFLPNRFMRFCTTELKIRPIYEWVQSQWDMVEMNIGFRADEPNRVFRMLGGEYKNKAWNFNNFGKCEQDPTAQYKRVDWRFRQAPMFVDGVTKADVHNDPWIKSQPFPEISNCTHCPFHKPAEHRQQHQAHPKAIEFWAGLEESTGNTFANGITLREIIDGGRSPLLEELEPCHCTD